MEKVKILLGNSVNDEQVEVIYSLLSDRLLDICKRYDKTLQSVPAPLEYIIVEATIERFNLIGSEGMSEERFENYSAKYINSEDIFDKYLKSIGLYFDSLDDDVKAVGKVRFI